MNIDDKETRPFSFEELRLAGDSSPPPPQPEIIKASDGTDLAVRVYEPSANPAKAALVFYHGGGAHSCAGYQHIGRGLSDDFGVAVYTPDLRGHGDSGGTRGDSPSVSQVFQDVTTVLEYAKSQRNSSIPLLLGGHSSGGGLVLNYSSWPESIKVMGYLLVSPQLGHKSDTTRQLKYPFATVNVLSFIANGIFGVVGHSKAVRFNYPNEILVEDPKIVSWNTVNMANAISPENPSEQFQRVDTPLGLWVGSDDELFHAEKVVKFAENVQGLKEAKIIQGENHLGILVKASNFLGPWIEDIVKQA